jgi:hypothetical protein
MMGRFYRLERARRRRGRRRRRRKRVAEALL